MNRIDFGIPAAPGTELRVAVHPHSSTPNAPVKVEAASAPPSARSALSGSPCLGWDVTRCWVEKVRTKQAEVALIAVDNAR